VHIGRCSVKFCPFGELDMFEKAGHGFLLTLAAYSFLCFYGAFSIAKRSSQ
jgi:hypothetical protein